MTPSDSSHNCTSTIGKPTEGLRRNAGFSLVELVIAMFVLAMLSLAFTKGLAFAKYTAEDNLYEATALTIALGAIEQMKGVKISTLSNPAVDGSGNNAFNILIGNGKTEMFTLGQENSFEVPVISAADGTAQKEITLKMTPQITPAANNRGYWLAVEYSWDHPRNGRTRTATVRNMRSLVETL